MQRAACSHRPSFVVEACRGTTPIAGSTPPPPTSSTLAGPDLVALGETATYTALHERSRRTCA
jgi:hypothetical protein